MTTILPFPLDSAAAYLGNQRADGKSFERARLRRGSL